MNLLSLRNNWLKVQDCRKITNRFRGIYRICFKFNKGKPEDVNMWPVGLANTRISTDYAQKFPDHWPEVLAVVGSVSMHSVLMPYLAIGSSKSLLYWLPTCPGHSFVRWARDLWSLHKLIYCEGENVMIHFTSRNWLVLGHIWPWERIRWEDPN